MFDFYVNPLASGDPVGIDWYNAYTTFSGVLGAMASGVPHDSGVNLYVAYGDYYADTSLLYDEVNFFGGYVIPFLKQPPKT